MAQKTILAYIPSERRAAQVLRMAVNAASLTGAHVIGLHVVATFPPYGELADALPSETIRRLREPALREAEAVKTIFNDTMTSNTVSSEWCQMTEDYSAVVDLVVQEARGADLVVCGNREPNDPFNSWLDIPDRLMLESGRPVLFLPLAPSTETFGQRALIAWNNTREATRAVYDAADFLAPGAAVDVLTINPPGRQSQLAYATGTHIVEALKRRGMDARSDAVTLKDTSTGDYILSRIRANNHDLLVMGCYGRSRIREMLLGGVTREILHDVNIPAIMSH